MRFAIDARLSTSCRFLHFRLDMKYRFQNSGDHWNSPVLRLINTCIISKNHLFYFDYEDFLETSVKRSRRRVDIISMILEYEMQLSKILIRSLYAMISGCCGRIFLSWNDSKDKNTVYHDMEIIIFGVHMFRKRSIGSRIMMGSSTPMNSNGATSRWRYQKFLYKTILTRLLKWYIEIIFSILSSNSLSSKQNSWTMTMPHPRAHELSSYTHQSHQLLANW